ncbi:arsenic resistance protein, partial [Acinetobacter baumannii]
PVWLRLLLGGDAAAVVAAGPFLHAFGWLIVLPLVLAAVLQLLGRRSAAAQRAVAGLALLPVPATALVLFVVIAAVVPLLAPASAAAWRVVP